jgi:hypothetical protein
MRLGTRIGAACALAALTGCGAEGTRLNPLNWFGNERSERLAAEVSAARSVVDQVLSVDVAPTPSGAIVSAIGLPPTQGFWEAELRPVATDDPSVLLLDFGILPPARPQPQGTQPSREVLAGAAFSNQELAGIRTIVVRGARNQRSVSRR